MSKPDRDQRAIDTGLHNSIAAECRRTSRLTRLLTSEGTFGGRVRRALRPCVAQRQR
jgi:hypothetical protein